MQSLQFIPFPGDQYKLYILQDPLWQAEVSNTVWAAKPGGLGWAGSCWPVHDLVRSHLVTAVPPASIPNFSILHCNHRVIHPKMSQWYLCSLAVWPQWPKMYLVPVRIWGDACTTWPVLFQGIKRMEAPEGRCDGDQAAVLVCCLLAQERLFLFC